MPIGICPTVDFVFKLLFGNPKHSRIAIHFLNAILQHLLKVNKIVFRNPIQEQETEDDKLSILDILATDEHGRTFIIEMQTSVPAGMGQRLTYYTACEYVDQLGKGQDYVSLRPVISICVLTDPMFRKSTRIAFAFRASVGDWGDLDGGFASSCFAVVKPAGDRREFAVCEPVRAMVVFSVTSGDVNDGRDQTIITGRNLQRSRQCSGRRGQDTGTKAALRSPAEISSR